MKLNYSKENILAKYFLISKLILLYATEKQKQGRNIFNNNLYLKLTNGVVNMKTVSVKKVVLDFTLVELVLMAILLLTQEVQTIFQQHDLPVQTSKLRLLQLLIWEV